MGDIRIYALQLEKYVSGQTVTHLCVHLTTPVENKLLEDDGNVLLKSDSGPTDLLMASQVGVKKMVAGFGCMVKKEV